MIRLDVSIIISIYNEAAGLEYFWNSLKKELTAQQDVNFELLWVNDGSLDTSQKIIDSIREEGDSKNINNISLEFSKNFGHESAMIAGIDNATGDAIICIDSDGQHPSTEISKMIAAYKEGNDIVLMKRIVRNDNSYLKKQFSKWFYKVLNALSTTIRFEENSTDFFLISKQIKGVLGSNFRDQNRFIRGFIQSIGFSRKTLEFSAPERKFGESNYSYYNLAKLAFNAIFSFSNKPLRISIFLSAIFIVITLGMIFFSLFNYINGGEAPSGYYTIIIFMSASFSILFITLSVLSLYFEKIIQEIRRRPLYIVKRKSSK